MKSKWLLCLLVFYPVFTCGQSKRVLRKYVRDSLSRLVQRCDQLLDHPYMAGKLLYVTDTIPGWEGFPVKLCSYQTGKDLYTGISKEAKVFLLDPSPERLAMWIVTTCWEVKRSVDYKYINEVFMRVRNQSGAQFPIKGLVYEDQYTRYFYEPYVFKDGVTVYVKDSSRFPRDKTCTPAQIDYYLHLSDGQIKLQTGQYARIAGTTREDYLNAGGKIDVGSKKNRKIKWLEVVRALYKKAMRSDKNELMIMWAKSHLN